MSEVEAMCSCHCIHVCVFEVGAMYSCLCTHMYVCLRWGPCVHATVHICRVDYNFQESDLCFHCVFSDNLMEQKRISYMCFLNSFIEMLYIVCELSKRDAHHIARFHVCIHTQPS